MRPATVLLAAVAGGLLLLASAQGGAFPGSNGLIAFTCGADVCTAGSDGTIYSDPLVTSALEPVWSPDGSQIAFVRASSGGGDLDVWTAAADGSNAQLVVHGATDPAWTPGGDLAYVKTSDNHVYVRQSNIETPLTTGVVGPSSAEENPAYSSTGRLAFDAAPTGSGQVNLYVLNGSSATQIAANVDEYRPSWSPDGGSIAYSAGGSLYVYSFVSSSSSTVGSVSGSGPAFSPGGDKLAYVSQHGRPAVTDLNGSNAVELNSFLSATDVDWGSAAAPSSGSGGTSGNGPTNTAYPKIFLAANDTGPVVGHTLTATTGSWTGTFPLTYSFQWKRCDPSDPVNGACVDIAGATSSAYTPTPADYKNRLRVAVTAKDSAGQTEQNSEVTAIVDALAARSAVTPQITPGPPQQTRVGDSLTLTGGSWAGSTPIAFTYQWKRCDPAGTLESCVPIVGATTPGYVPTVADIGFSLRAWITGSNLAGSDTTVTNHTYPVVDKAHFGPSATTAPAIVGTALPGRQLTANIGVYAGDAPIATTFGWFRCDATGESCHVIPDAKTRVYHPTGADVGFTLRLLVFASNAYGKLVTRSDPTATVAGVQPHRRGLRIVGTAHADYLAGTGRDDTILGRGGNDTLLGGNGYDHIDGGPGNDVITGGAGADVLLGGAGSDTIYAADGERDVVDCGAGKDHAIVDDVDVVRNCEAVDVVKQP